MWSQAHIMFLVNKLMIKILNLKLEMLSEYQNIKVFLQKTMFQIGFKKLLWLKKFKNNLLWAYVISDIKSKDIVWAFFKKVKCKKQIKKSLELKKYSKEKAINYMSNGKTRIILLTVQLIKKT